MDLREWLETNGTGAFAMGTAAGLATRRYHALLIAALRPPTDRIAVLARVDETVNGIELATVQYPGVVSPAGHERLIAFSSQPVPTWVYDIEGVRLEKRLFLVPGEQAVVLRYRASSPLKLRAAPFLALRDYHALGRVRPVDETIVERTLGAARSVRLAGLRLWYSGGPFLRDPVWYLNTEYSEERARGLDYHEDLWRPGSFELDVNPEAWVVATLGDESWNEDKVATVERARRLTGATLEDRLAAAAEQFLVRRRDGSLTVIAGYPWFTDWGRDTMIALPGLLLAATASNRLSDVENVLRGFLAFLDRGLLPNLFPDRGQAPEYNTVDATLWLFQAVRAYLEAGGTQAFVLDEVYPAAKEIIRWHRRGTHHDVRTDADGLLIGGGPGSNLTWMDARVDGRVITPRHGKAVEINALWYNALREVAGWARAAGEPTHARDYDSQADRVRAAFLPTFWNAARGCLFDVVRTDEIDSRIRPNQLFALALPHELVPRAQAESILAVCESLLLTPVGLRTLAPDDPAYVPHYRGGPLERDSSYHQGTVWPWLLGPYIRAVLAVRGRTAKTLAQCRAALAGLEAHLDDHCIGTVAEVFDAAPPHRPGGAPAQAWSVAAMLEALRLLRS